MDLSKFALGIVAGVLLAAVMAASIFTATAQTTNSAPNVTVTSVTSATAVQIIGQNPGRKSIQICNVGTGVQWIWPGPLSPAVSAYELPALCTGTTTCFTPPPIRWRVTGGSIGQATPGMRRRFRRPARLPFLNGDECSGLGLAVTAAYWPWLWSPAMTPKWTALSLVAPALLLYRQQPIPLTRAHLAGLRPYRLGRAFGIVVGGAAL